MTYSKIQLLPVLAVVLALSTHQACFAQRIGKADMKLGPLLLGAPFDSIAIALGKEDSTRLFDQEWTNFIAHYYHTLIVWTNKRDKRIWAFDIYDTTLITTRGLRIGDSVQTIDKLYPRKRNWVEKKFSRTGPYDYTFKDYSEAIILENDIQEPEGWFLILFTRNNRLVKMLFYIGVYE